MGIPYKIAIVGGGAAGFFAAINSAMVAEKKNIAVDIRIFESSDQYLKKVKISGGGRCNVTHNCFDVRTFCQNYPRGSRELLSPMQRFQAKDTVEWFKKAGVNLVAEDDGRMFPDTNTSETIIDCYLEFAEKYKVQLMPKYSVKKILTNGDSWDLHFKDNDTFKAQSVLIATGSSPGGYSLAASLGHTISERAPSLFSFKIKDPLINDLPGLSFSNTSLKLTLPDKKSFKQVGPTLITHWGLSGPAILKLSAWAAREMKRAGYKASLSVNWLGAESFSSFEETLNELKENNSKSFLKNVYPEALPKRFWLSLLDKLNIPQRKQWANISKKDSTAICNNVINSQMTVLGQNRFKDEFVECGGVALKEINFKSMESKVSKGIYFSGELLDVDGITGGFNFQNAWTTAWVAAQHMIEQAEKFAP